MSCTVIVESSARKEIDEAYRWMAKSVSPKSATLWYLDIYAALDSLKEFPARCGLAVENQFFKEKRFAKSSAGSIASCLRLTARQFAFCTCGIQRESH